MQYTSIHIPLLNSKLLKFVEMVWIDFLLSTIFYFVIQECIWENIAIAYALKRKIYCLPVINFVHFIVSKANCISKKNFKNTTLFNWRNRGDYQAYEYQGHITLRVCASCMHLLQAKILGNIYFPRRRADCIFSVLYKHRLNYFAYRCYYRFGNLLPTL